MQKQQRRKVCRYYARGKCVKQDCPFVHQQQTKKPCKFYVQTGYCRKGKNCEFYHATKQEEKKDKKFVEKHESNAKVQQKPNYQDINNFNKVENQLVVEEKKQTKQDAIDSLLGLKLKEELLKELTENEGKQQGKEKLQFFKIYPKSFPDYSKTPQIKQYIKQTQVKYFQAKPFLTLLKQATTDHEKQYYQIIRRFQDSFQLEEQTQTRIYTIKLRPLLYDKEMPMHFKLEQPYIHIHINQLQYPDVKARFQILNPSIPSAYKSKFVDFLDKHHMKNCLFQTLKYLQNHFEKVYQTSKFKLQNQHFKKVQLKQKIQSQKDKIQKNIQSMRPQQLSRKNEVKPQIQQKQKLQRIASKKQQPKIKGQQKAVKQYRDYIEMQFSGLEKPEHQNLNDEIVCAEILLQNSPYLVVQKLLLYIECNCSKVLMYLFDAEQRKQLKLWVKLKCKKCNDCMRIVWQRQVIQYKSTVISKMSISNGKIVDIGGIAWKVGCNCDEEIFKNKLYLPGEKFQLNCHTCFSNMNIMYNGIKFFNPFVKQFQMQQDKELPLKGACNHDKLNFKWNRYACCGRPFACDQCHDLGSIKNHDIFQGITMICGFCAHEQAVSSQCLRCKKQLIRGIDKAGHWQGGLGCRDQTLLSKKDAKKYTGVNKPANKKKQKQKQK